LGQVPESNTTRNMVQWGTPYCGAFERKTKTSVQNEGCVAESVQGFDECLGFSLTRKG